MPYKRNQDIPKSVRNVLPAAAQTIWRKAFNNADKKYKNEVRSIKIAWAAVKRAYKKRNGKWVKK